MSTNYSPSFRAQLLTRRTYNRPIENSDAFETWEQTVDRVISHQRWLWERALGKTELTSIPVTDIETGEVSIHRKNQFSAGQLSAEQETELLELRQLMLDRKTETSGRTLWLGGTDIAKTREASQFNCSFQTVQTVYDIVDAFWLLLQGCGVGFEPVVGTLNGFTKQVEVEVIRSRNSSIKGRETNTETFYTRDDGKKVWRLGVGDSAEAWAKALGKLVAMKKPVDVIELDFSEIRKGGIRLRGYGWISSGDATIHIAFSKIADIFNKRAGQLLTRIDILDVLNWMGTTLSSRRSAEIAVMPSNDPEAEDFILAKKDYWLRGNDHRQQSNNSVIFYDRPTKLEIKGIFSTMMDAGGSEPGFLNGTSALTRARWFKGVNPCAEILLGNKSFCNLVETDLGKFLFDFPALLRALYLSGRANYRQTCVNLRDGILSDAWHELNEFLRLCGVGITGIVKFMDFHEAEGNGDKLPEMFQQMRAAAQDGCHSMADELGLPRAKAVTTIKPSGTLSKIMDTTEGVHRPLAKYIFNNVNFSIHDPLLIKLANVGYHMFPNPSEPTSMLVRLPASFEGVNFDTVILEGDRQVEVNSESAIKQLERYKLMMDNYVDHNCSITINYDPSEVSDIVNWLEKNWDTYVGVSWIYKQDPLKIAGDAEAAAKALGYAYLPQQIVTAEEYYDYVSTLKPVDLDGVSSLDDLLDADCATGACPVR